MTDWDLFVYMVRDRKWRNGYLCIAAEALCEGKPLDEFLDKGEEKKFNKWLKQIKEE